MDATTRKKTLAVRRKIVALFSRSQLEKLSGLSSPWLADTNTLKQAVMTKWPKKAIQDEFTAIMYKAE